MKKLLSFVLAVLMILSVISASAESEFDEAFSIRNGIKYSMSLEEIKHVEIQNGNEEIDQDISDLFGDEVACTFFTEVAGISSYLIYWVDEDTHLSDFQYLIFDPSAYDMLEDTLITKYGKALMTEAQLPFQTKTMESFNNYKDAHCSPRITNYASWLLRYKDCCVVVELMKYSTKYTSPLLILNYCPISHEEAETVMNETKKQIEEATQSANDDL